MLRHAPGEAASATLPPAGPRLADLIQGVKSFTFNFRKHSNSVLQNRSTLPEGVSQVGRGLWSAMIGLASFLS
jgi:hypothetical protein